MSNKKYKLLAAPADGRKAQCAFFITAAGCRQGDACKFSHELNDSKDVNNVTEHGSVVSSESEPEYTTTMGKSKDVDDINPFAPPGNKGGEENETKKKNRRGKRSEDDPPFANPKKKVKVETTINPSSVTPSKNQKKAPKTPVESSTPPSNFLTLSLPIASFSLPTAKNSSSSKKNEPNSSSKDEQAAAGESEKKDKRDNGGFVLPKSNPAAKKWIDAIQATQASKAFLINYNFAKYKQRDEESGICSANGWIKAKKYGSWCEKFPQVIAIDCEMCETQDPVSGDKNTNALCRISIVDAVTKEVLLDSLCKPAWPVTNHRSWVNGITEEHLQNVQFTVRHAQAFLMALCSDETVIVGHAVHNDLAAVRMEHYCVVDSALLFKATDSETATVSLKDSAKSILGKDMPDTHDSVNDAVTALECLEYYLQKGSDMKTIDRSPNTPSAGKSYTFYASQLFVHRIPNTVNEEHLTQLFVAHADIKPQSVESIEFQGSFGKTHVVFRSPEHATLAFQYLEGGKPEPDPSGRLQKKVFLRNKSYIRVRKMAFEKSEKTEKALDDQDSVTEKAKNLRRASSG